MAYGQQRKQYDDTNKGVIFPNDRKETEKQPDFKGSINIEGRDYWISGWKKSGKKGPLVSLSVQAKQEQRERQHQQRAPQRDPFDDAPPPRGPEDYGADPFDL